MAELLIGGRWMADVCHVSELTWTSRWDHTGASGCWEASWNLDLPPNVSLPFLGRGALVQVRDGATDVFTGMCEEPDKSRDGWTVAAVGEARRAGRFDAISASNAPSTNPGAVVDAAIARGWNVTRPSGVFTSVAISDDSQQLNSVEDVLDAYCEQNALVWGAWADRVLFTAPADATAPRHAIAPEVALMGTAEDDWFSSVRVKFIDGPATDTAGFVVYDYVREVNAAAVTRWDVREKGVDRTGLGKILPGVASSIATNLLSRLSPRMGWANPLDLGAVDLSTLSDAPTYLPSVRAGDGFRGWGLVDSQGTLAPSHATDFTAGEVRYKDGEQSIYVAPMGLATRNLGGLLEDMTATTEQLDAINGIRGAA